MLWNFHPIRKAYDYFSSCNRNYSSPIGAELEKGINVLDAGCGGGTWTLVSIESVSYCSNKWSRNANDIG
jgi:ubiquinone/menaquinone biosynthesis C-methylase UbiE